MILKNDSGRYALLRKLAVIPVLGILFSLFSLTQKQAIAQSAQQSVIQSPIEGQTECADFDSFRQWVMANIIYPKQAQEQKLTATVHASFKVGVDGKVKDVKVVSSSNQILTDEVLRVFSKAPDWRPIMQDGKPVEVSFMLPISFQHQNQKSTPQNRPGEIVVASY